MELVHLEILGVWDPPVYRIFFAPTRDVLVDRFIEITHRRFDGGSVYLVGGSSINDNTCVVKHADSPMTVDGMFCRNVVPSDIQQLYLVLGWLPIIKDNQMKTQFVFSVSDEIASVIKDIQKDYPHRLVYRRLGYENLWGAYLAPYIENVAPDAIIFRFTGTTLQSILDFDINTPP